ncbi:MAG: DUF2490 domain-containing protein [Candidatus Eremiobacteraeota bacterium]|nr:DUF2490 domain-containing protein [Candidatus Eremiobacteraeota bacterium]
MRNPGRRIKNFHLVVFSFLCLVMAPAPAFSETEGSGETWVKGAFEIPLAPQLKTILSLESHYDRDGLYFQSREMTLFRSISRTIDLELVGYRSVEKLDQKVWQGENDFFGGIIFNGRLGPFTLSNRNRFEFLTFCYDNPSYVRYRNKLTLSLPGKITPYLADEFFYDIGDNHPGWNKNRVSLGLKGDIGQEVNLDVYFMRQTDANYLDEGEPRPRFNITGGNLTIRF